ncbi:hypothetical protein RIF29_37733 [Crotalaria pallida]|uniref:Uncharacterized protein n=1 Tax=Crotalaria pallida TaxID=3830 RepID=A0AAN9EEN8_CROPI
MISKAKSFPKMRRGGIASNGMLEALNSFGAIIEMKLKQTQSAECPKGPRRVKRGFGAESQLQGILSGSVKQIAERFSGMGVKRVEGNSALVTLDGSLLALTLNINIFMAAAAAVIVS